MAWATLDDQMPDHPKVAGLSDASFRLHVAGICYCARHLTDGLIHATEVPRLVRRYKPSALVELVTRGIWRESLIDGQVEAYEIHDYLQWNLSRAKVDINRQKARDRMAAARAKREAEA